MKANLVAVQAKTQLVDYTGRVGASWEEGVIAMADKPDAEEIVAATVEVDGRR